VGKKQFSAVDYSICDPKKCNPDSGKCLASTKCSYKVIKQIDGAFEPPVVFHDLCMGCWDCVDACPLSAVYIKRVV
jgi:ATP-binding cassette subfamily E protein 1